MTRSDYMEILSDPYAEQDLRDEAQFMVNHYDTIAQPRTMRPTQPIPMAAQPGKFIMDRAAGTYFTDDELAKIDTVVKQVKERITPATPISLEERAIPAKPVTATQLADNIEEALSTEPKLGGTKLNSVSAKQIIDYSKLPAVNGEEYTMEELAQAEMDVITPAQFKKEVAAAQSGVAPSPMLTTLDDDSILAYAQHRLKQEPQVLATTLLREIKRKHPQVDKDPANLLLIKRYLRDPSIYTGSSLPVQAKAAGTDLASGFGQTAGGLEQLAGKALTGLGGIADIAGNKMGLNTGIADVITSSGDRVQADAQQVKQYWDEFATEDSTLQEIGRIIPLLASGEGFIAPAIAATAEQLGKNKTTEQALGLGLLTGGLNKLAGMIIKGLRGEVVDLTKSPKEIVASLSPKTQAQLVTMSEKTNASPEQLIDYVKQFSPGAKQLKAEDILRVAGDKTGDTEKILAKFPWLRGSRGPALERADLDQTLPWGSEAGGRSLELGLDSLPGRAKPQGYLQPPVKGGVPIGDNLWNAKSGFIRTEGSGSGATKAAIAALNAKTGGIGNLLLNMVRDLGRTLTKSKQERIVSDIGERILTSLEKGNVPITDLDKWGPYLSQMVTAAIKSINAGTDSNPVDYWEVGEERPLSDFGIITEDQFLKEIGR